LRVREDEEDLGSFAFFFDILSPVRDLELEPEIREAKSGYQFRCFHAVPAAHGYGF
jgi:hypothetical protein